MTIGTMFFLYYNTETILPFFAFSVASRVCTWNCHLFVMLAGGFASNKTFLYLTKNLHSSLCGCTATQNAHPSIHDRNQKLVRATHYREEVVHQCMQSHSNNGYCTSVYRQEMEERRVVTTAFLWERLGCELEQNRF